MGAAAVELADTGVGAGTGTDVGVGARDIAGAGLVSASKVGNIR